MTQTDPKAIYQSEEQPWAAPLSDHPSHYQHSAAPRLSNQSKESSPCPLPQTIQAPLKRSKDLIFAAFSHPNLSVTASKSGLGIGFYVGSRGVSDPNQREGFSSSFWRKISQVEEERSCFSSIFWFVLMWTVERECEGGEKEPANAADSDTWKQNSLIFS